MQVLGVRIVNLSKTEVLNKVGEFFSNAKQNTIFTPNPEMLVDAQKDEYFKQVLNSSSLNVCDGFGITLVSGVKRYPGVDLMQDLCVLAEKEGKSVYLLGSGSEEVIVATINELKKRFSKLKISGFNKGLQIVKLSNCQIDYKTESNDEILNDIILSAPDILFVAFGHGKQEKWIQENLKHLPSIKIAMGVGGAFDFISGKAKRAPLLMRKIGLEWLYRLIKEPWRIGRILKATVYFLYLYGKNKICS